MTDDLASLLKRVRAVTGSDRDLDRALATTLQAKPAAYSSSIDACVALIEAVMPNWHWHVGYDASGIFPYASLAHGGVYHKAGAPTVPLALLRVLVQAVAADRHSGHELKDDA